MLNKNLEFIRQFANIHKQISNASPIHGIFYAPKLGFTNQIKSLPNSMSWHVYIVKCADNSLYTGVAKNIAQRVTEHNSCDKKAAKYTRARRPVVLVYSEYCTNRSAAQKREWQLKTLSRQQKLELIERFKQP